MRSLFKELKYALYVAVHPFKGFWDLKHEKKGSMSVAFILLSLAVLTALLSGAFTDYLMNPINALEFNVIKTAAMVIALFFAWCIANWCFTCLFDGEGTFKDIVIFTGYSLAPYIIIQLVMIVFSGYMVLSESSFYAMLSVFSQVWLGFLLFCGTLVTHQYSFGKTILMCIVTLFGIAILAYIILLFFNLIQQMLGFISALLYEISLR